MTGTHSSHTSDPLSICKLVLYNKVNNIVNMRNLNIVKYGEIYVIRSLISIAQALLEM